MWLSGQGFLEEGEDCRETYSYPPVIDWYREFNALEKNLDSGEATFTQGAAQAEIDRIDAAVRRIRLPHHFSNQIYDLRGPHRSGAAEAQGEGGSDGGSVDTTRNA